MLLCRLQRVLKRAKTMFFPLSATVVVQELADMNYQRDENSVCIGTAKENEMLLPELVELNFHWPS